ncbi:diacylglycerol kinase family protein [Demequina sp.]|uniref:diacylglycerol kinase family protein n=1 Tax=Demequina sp. TaxID=2050685 RepID=UPI0025D14721|nr:diacylglycerol kinase family protein [Demequina sp.]
MTRAEGRVRRRLEMYVFLAALALYALWTTAVVRGWTDGIDSWFPAPAVDARSTAGQILETFGIITSPFAVVLIALAQGARAFQQRQRRLGTALLIAAVGLPLWQVQRAVVARPRPASAFEDSLAALGTSYPAGHVVAAVILTGIVVTVANAQRRSSASQWRARIGGLAVVVSIVVTQWAMGIHYNSDLVGGALFGATIGWAALFISGVEAIAEARRARTLPPKIDKTAAVIYNPIKVNDLDVFHRRVAYEMARKGWDAPVWLETREDDPGRQMSHDAIAKEVDLVIVAGGDGTVRAVCAELAGSDIPVAIIPAGTGNLLGRNLGIPLDEDGALDVALTGAVRSIDVVNWKTDGVESPFVVMAGVGLDAQIMRDTNKQLKKLVKGGAYVVAGVQQAGMEPFHAKVTLDGSVVHDGEAIVTMVGNVGKLQGGFELIPSARAEDGSLHVLVAKADGVQGLVRLLGTFGRPSGDGPLRRMTGNRVEVELDRDVPYQLDGDLEGETARFSAEVQPGALRVMVPR